MVWALLQALRQEAALAQLCTQLHTAQEKERHTAQTLAAAKSITQELKRQATSWQASQREALEQVRQGHSLADWTKEAEGSRGPR